MFDALKRRKQTMKSAEEQRDELQALIDTAREERGALSTMLTQIEVRAGKVSLPQVSKAVKRATDRATAASEQLEVLAGRLAAFEERGKEIAKLDGRVQALTDTLVRAEGSAQKLLAPDGELQKHRAAVQQLSSQALQTSASLETLKNDQATQAEMRRSLRKSVADLTGATERAEALQTELEQLRTASGGLAKDYAKLKDSVRQAKNESVATAETVKEIDTKLGHFKELHQLSKTTEKRIGALNALAEHVSQKTKALENQKHTVEHALVESNRLNELVWSMDVQIAKLQDGGRQAAQTEELVGRIEQLARDTQAQLQTATQSKEQLSTDVDRLGRDREELAEFMRGYLERLTVERKEFDALEQRVGALRTAIGTVEASVDAVVAKDREAAAIGQRLEVMGARLGTLSTQTNELQERQHELDSLQERLGQVEELSKTNRWHHDNLTRSQEVLEHARKDIEAFYASYAEAAKLREQLGADRTALEGFLGRVDSFSRQMPDLDARMNAIVNKLSIVDEGTQKAAALATTVGTLEQQMARIATQQQHVGRVEGRLNALHELSRSIDGQIADQVGRSGEIEGLRNLCDGLSIQVTDEQHKLEAVAALQHKLLPMATQLTALGQQLEAEQKQFKEARKSEEEIREQGRRLAELHSSLRDVASDVEARLKQVQGLGEELGRSTAIRDELLEELGRVQFKQREVGANLLASEDQLQRVEATTKQLERRRSQLAFGEKKISQFEGRLSDLKGMANELERQIQSVATRETFVESIRKEVEGIHAISTRSKADLQHVVDHCEDVVKLKQRVDDVLACVAETEQRMAIIEARRSSVDEAQRKTNVIVNVLEDVQVNLETLTEQKSVIDHAVENVATLNATVQAARATQQTLQAERELAERIESGIKQLRARTGEPARGQRSA